MNIDAKILNIMNPGTYKNTIHHVWVRFLSGAQGWFKIHKSINVIYYINKKKSKTT